MRVLLPLFPLVLAACFTTRGGQNLNARGVLTRAAFDFDCPQDQVEVQDLDGRGLTFRAEGCGKRATYVWKGSTVILDSEIETSGEGEQQR